MKLLVLMLLAGSGQISVDGGVGRVLDKSKNNSNYSVKEGFEVFVVGCGTRALVAIVGPMAVKGVSKMLVLLSF